MFIPTCSLYVGLENFDKVLKTFKKGQQQLGEILSAVDVMDSVTMEFISEKNQQQSPIGEHPFHLLIETSGSNELHDSEKVNMFLDDIMNNNLISNGIVASEPSKIEVSSLHKQGIFLNVLTKHLVLHKQKLNGILWTYFLYL